MKIRKIIGYFLYNAVFKHFPISYSKLQMGQTAMRRMCGKLILDDCGKNVNIEKGAVFSSRCTLGNNSGIGINAKIGVCHIGKDVMMGEDCRIYTRNHEFNDVSVPMDQQGFQNEEPVTIGDDVWIGGRVTILPGVNVGSHSIIGASAVVTHDVPEWAVVAGNPAVVKKYRNE